MLVLDKEKRIQEMNIFIIPYMQDCAQASVDTAATYYEQNQADILESFVKTLQCANQQTVFLQKEGQKDAVKYIHLSYLISGAITKKETLKIDFYDHRYYADLAEIDVFWDYQNLFSSLQANFTYLTNALKKQFTNVKTFEIEELYLAYRTLMFPALEQICKSLVENPAVWDALKPISANRLEILFGGYLSESNRIGFFTKEVNNGIL